MGSIPVRESDFSLSHARVMLNISSFTLYLMTNRELCIPWLGYDGGAVLVQGAIGEQATDSYKVPFLLLTVIDQAMVAFTYNMQVELLKQ